MKFIPCCILLIVLLTLTAAPSLAQRGTLRKEYKRVLDRYFSVAAEMKNFNGNILIAKDDSILYQKSLGMANYEFGIPIDFNSKIRIASLTKTFTAAAIEILIKRGKITLDETIDRFIPDFPAGKKIRINDLLLHQSGVADPDWTSLNFVHHLASDDVLKTITSHPLKFEPGTNSSYSNGGYFILAYIVQKVSGQSFGQFLKENIFKPLSMNDSGVYEDDPIIRNRAASYIVGPNNELINVDWYASEPSMGSGYLYSTINDLYKWCKSVKNKTLVDVYSQQYPYGWGRRKTPDSIHYISQSGYNIGEQGLIMVYENGYYIIYNNNLSNLLFNKIYEDVPAILFGRDFKMPQLQRYITLPDSALLKFCGHYHWESHSDFKVAYSNGALYFQWNNDAFRSYLLPLSAKTFEQRDEFSIFDFTMDADNHVDGVSISNGGNPVATCKKVGGSDNSAHAW